MTVSVKDLKGKGPADTEITRYGVRATVNVQIDGAYLADSQASTEAKVDFANTMAHESAHGMYGKQTPWKFRFSREDVKRDEVRGYTLGTYVNEAFRVNDRFGIWSVSSGWNTQRLDEAAEKSTEAVCEEINCH